MSHTDLQKELAHERRRYAKEAIIPLALIALIGFGFMAMVLRG